MNLTDVQETVYQTSHTGKIHLDTNCKYLRNRDDWKDRPSETIPESHVDLCSWCEQYLEDWKDGVSPPKAKECARCGKRDVQRQYCESCIQQIALRR